MIDVYIFDTFNVGMNVNDLPNKNVQALDEKITFCCTSKMKRELYELKSYGKDPSTILRMVIDEFLSKLELPDKAS